MQVTKTDKGLIKAWTDGIEVEPQAMQQILNVKG